MINKIVFIILIVAIVSGCEGKEQAKEVPQEVKAPVETAEVKKELVPEIRPNQPPRIASVDVIPLNPKRGDTIKITAKATDPDGDAVGLTYRWFRNNELLPETSDSLTLTKDFKRGDSIMLNIIPYDGKVTGDAGIMRVDIANSPPELTSYPSEGRFEGRRFIYQVKAVDADDDALSYSLKDAPAGMTIGKTDGLITWDVPEDFKGKASVTVSVTDGHAGETIQSFVIEVNP